MPPRGYHPEPLLPLVEGVLNTAMRAEDVTATLDLALRASGLDWAEPAQRPRLLSDKGSSYTAADLAKWLGDREKRCSAPTSYQYAALTGRIAQENSCIS
jgi:transposase InsO family protein